METKLDRLQRNAIAAKRRKDNITALTGLLQEAKEILAVIPSKGYEAVKERETVNRRIKHITALIEDERKDLESLEVADDSETAALMAKLG